jgi:hypothetical protein
MSVTFFIGAVIAIERHKPPYLFTVSEEEM